jgi:hypothetical protein
MTSTNDLHNLLRWAAAGGSPSAADRAKLPALVRAALDKIGEHREAGEHGQARQLAGATAEQFGDTVDLGPDVDPNRYDHLTPAELADLVNNR